MVAKSPQLTVKLPTTVVFVLLVWFAREHGWLNESLSPAPSASDRKGVPGMEGRCIRVIDGDTLDVQVGGERHRVRIIGIDCPESHNEEKAARQARTWSLTTAEVRRQGQAATAWLERRAEGRPVRLVLPGGRSTDDYDRLLAYVEVDGKDVGALLLQEGLAESRREPHPRKQSYEAMEDQARRQRKGLWRPARKPENPHAVH